MHTLEPINIKILKLIKFVNEIYNTRNSKSKMATHDTTKLELFITRFHPEAGTKGVRKRGNWGIFRYFRVQTSLANQSIEDCEESRKLGNVSRAQILITREGEGRAFIGDKLPRSRTLMSFSTRPLSHNEKKLVCSKVRGPMGKLF